MTLVIVTNRAISSETSKLNYPGLTFQSMGLFFDQQPPFIYYADQRYDGIDQKKAFEAITAEFNRRGGMARVFDVKVSGYFNMLAELEEKGEPVRALQYGHVTPASYEEIKTALQGIAKSHP